MTDYQTKITIEEGCCPLLKFPCSEGDEKAKECCSRVFGDFDPIAISADFKILECAANRAKRMHEGAIKYYY